MSDACKDDECVLKNIISRNVTCTNQSKMELIIYYKNRKTSNFVMNNNQGEVCYQGEDAVHQCSL